MCKTPYTPDQNQTCEGTAPGAWLTIISGRPFISPSQPTKSGNAWTLPSKSRISGELPGQISMELLSQLSTCPIK
jgi:hypothetical protein